VPVPDRRQAATGCARYHEDLARVAQSGAHIRENTGHPASMAKAVTSIFRLKNVGIAVATVQFRHIQVSPGSVGNR
jgi:hypothetical protein